MSDLVRASDDRGPAGGLAARPQRRDLRRHADDGRHARPSEAQPPRGRLPRRDAGRQQHGLAANG